VDKNSAMANAPTAPLVAVVEDDESSRRSVARLFLAADLQPIAYPSAEALLADGPPDRFDCLVLDIQLGGLSGIDVARRLSEIGLGGRIVILTAHDEPKYRADAALAGCTAFLSKSAPAAELLAAVRKAVAGGETKHGPRSSA
jgi:FixJ family two-component response regulator